MPRGQRRSAVLGIDAGTTGVTALLVTEDGQLAGRGYHQLTQHFPFPGGVEQEPEEIWTATLSACRQALAGSAHEPVCVGVANQRETAVLWHPARLSTPCRALVWQDRRGTAICARLREAGHEEHIEAITGLRLDPYFTATKLTWLAEHDRPVWNGVTNGHTVLGTVDSYLVARLTAGARHVTDASNASRTLLYDLTGHWSEELCELFGVPSAALPELVPSYGEIGRTDPEAFLGLDLPITGLAGDQQAALFGQLCHTPGATKCTYGTGAFVLTNTGATPVRSAAGLLTTVAWQQPDGALVYALEGSVFVTGAAVQWLRDGLGLISSAADVEKLARAVPDSGGVVFVPALTGLGTPHWDPDARGAIFGLTRGTTRAHLARATLEAIAFSIRDVVDVMTAAAGAAMPALLVDGGAAANDLLCQLQADQLAIAVQRPEVLETTALGAAFLAGLGAGVWRGPADLASTWRAGKHFAPGIRDDVGYARWRDAVRRSAGWASH